MSLWTAREVADATGGQVAGTWVAEGVSIDTRTLKAGDLFVALKDVRDGHDFVADALAKGASAALVSRVPEGVDPARCAIVGDVLEGLVALGRAGRARTAARVIGVTGSVGKTSTKEMLRTVLAGQGSVHAAEASYNNHWGVPLTLARLPVMTDFAVIEIGMNHPGEIAPLARLARPHIAIVTTVAPAHLEAFASVDEIAHEKGSIAAGLEPGGAMIVPGDLPTTPILLAEAQGHPVATFGTNSDADLVLLKVSLSDDHTIFQLGLDGAQVLGKLATPGRHFARNAAAVLTVVRLLDLDVAIAICDLGSWTPPSGRGTRETVTMDLVQSDASFELIDDAFNANPASMEAALEVLAAAKPKDGIGRVARGRRIAVLGDMLELGPNETTLHRDITKSASIAAIDVVHAVGPRMREMYKHLPESKRGHWYHSADEMVAAAKSVVDGGDVVLVKGSKGSHVSRVAEALRRLGQPLERRKKRED